MYYQVNLRLPGNTIFVELGVKWELRIIWAAWYHWMQLIDSHRGLFLKAVNFNTYFSGMMISTQTITNRSSVPRTIERLQPGCMFVIGSAVSILATAFDVHGEERWSRIIFGKNWKSARVNGEIISVAGRGRFTVRWDDGDERIHHRNQLRLADSATDEHASNDDTGSASGSDAEDLSSSSERSDESVSDSSAVPPGLIVGGVEWLPAELDIDPRNLPKTCFQVIGLSITEATSPVQMFLHLFPLTIPELRGYINCTARAERKRQGKRWTDLSDGELMIWLACFFAASQVNFFDLFRLKIKIIL